MGNIKYPAAVHVFMVLISQYNNGTEMSNWLTDHINHNMCKSINVELYIYIYHIKHIGC